MENNPQSTPIQAVQRALPPWKKPAVIVVTSLAAMVLLGGLAAAYFTYSPKTVFEGVTFMEQSLSGKTYDQAQQAITQALDDLSYENTLMVSIFNDQYPINTTLRRDQLDPKAIADEAYKQGREGTMFAQLFGRSTLAKEGYIVQLPIEIDAQGVRGDVADLAKKIASESDEKPIEIKKDKIYFDRGKVSAIIDEDALYEMVANRIVTLDFSPMTYTPAPQEINRTFVEMLAQTVNTTASEPTLDLASDPTGMTVVGGMVGVVLDVDGTLKALESSTEVVVEIPGEITQPKYTAAEYKAMLFRDTLSSQTTQFNPNLSGRTANVRIAGKDAQTILLPGQEYSYAQQVGRITRAKGYQDALVFTGGNVEDGLGGGVCQVSSTVYMAALYANLKISARKNHSFVVSYTPVGQDATFATGGWDLKFVNNTDFPIKIINITGKSSLTSKIVGTKTNNRTVKIETTIHSKDPFAVKEVYDPNLKPGERKVKNDGYTGYKASTQRIIYENGKEVSRSAEASSSYKRLDKVILVGTDPNTPVLKPDPGVPVNPVDPTKPPVDPTKPPVDPTKPPVDPAKPPVDPTKPPVDPTKPPVDPTKPPVDPAKPPVDPAKPPVDPEIPAESNTNPPT